MSYLHCPTCACAYNVTREPACPRCGVRAGAPADPTDDIVHAVEQLARAMARATPIEIITAQSRIDNRYRQLALPAPGDRHACQARAAQPSPTLFRAVRAALAPPVDAEKPTLTEKVAAVIDRYKRSAQAKFLFAKSQLTKVHQASMNFGRALR